MSEIQSPTVTRDHPDRHISCQFALQAEFAELVLRAVKAGWDQSEVVAALVDLADNSMLKLKNSDGLEAIFEAIKRSSGRRE